ncbi:glycosyltransferase family 2 protein [Candidatus Parcubacteria bacterium]|nr:glycosyltransferase family 2 protein [Candidatus Parcubacteria bacterium]
MPSNTSKVIGIIMTYNCAHLVEGIYNRLPKNVFDSIFITDDGSKDDIQKVAYTLGIECLKHEHTGYGGNIKLGLAKALEMGAEYMVEIHGDGQFSPEFIVPGLEKMKSGYDFILGSRFTDIRQPLRDKMPVPRYLANISLSFIDRLVLGLRLTEFHNGARIYSRRLIETIGFKNTSNDYLYSFEIIAQARYHNLKVGEVSERADYGKDHTSISMKKSIVYALKTFGVLGKYVLARIGFKTKLFR